MPCRVYIYGPMTGIPEHNFPAFREAAAVLRGLGYEVVDPSTLNEHLAYIDDEKLMWQACPRNDIKALMDCDRLVLLPGWEVSAGANQELHLARRVGIRPHIYNDFLQLHHTGRVSP